MIAPAMNTRTEDDLPYRDLARQQARIARKIGLDQMPRLAALLGSGADAADSDVDEKPFDVTLAFLFDADGHVKISGALSGSVWLDCHGCAETRQHRLDLSIECLVVDSESSADDLQMQSDVVLADGLHILVADVIEDEILLNLPERLCTEQPCENTPVLDYPVPGEGDGSVHEPSSDERDNPFAVLAEMNLPKR